MDACLTMSCEVLTVLYCNLEVNIEIIPFD